MSNPDIRLNIGWAITIANYLIQGLGLVKVLAIVVKRIYRKITQPEVIDAEPPRIQPRRNRLRLLSLTIIYQTLQ